MYKYTSELRADELGTNVRHYVFKAVGICTGDPESVSLAV
jgi:hypothetical protein